MSVNTSSNGNDVNSGAISKIGKTLDTSKVDEQDDFPKFCKKNSYSTFQSINLQKSDSSNNLGK